MTIKKLILNIFKLVFVASITFFIHFLVNSLIESNIDIYRLVYSYFINVLLALSVIVLLFVLQKKLKDQLGFVFLAGSLIKFALFFFLFLPDYKMNGDSGKLQFLIFFIPYSVCLITESVLLFKFLNSLDNSK